MRTALHNKFHISYYIYIMYASQWHPRDAPSESLPSASALREDDDPSEPPMYRVSTPLAMWEARPPSPACCCCPPERLARAPRQRPDPTPRPAPCRPFAAEPDGRAARHRQQARAAAAGPQAAAGPALGSRKPWDWACTPRRRAKPAALRRRRRLAALSAQSALSAPSSRRRVSLCRPTRSASSRPPTPRSWRAAAACPSPRRRLRRAPAALLPIFRRSTILSPPACITPTLCPPRPSLSPPCSCAAAPRSSTARGLASMTSPSAAVRPAATGCCPSCWRPTRQSTENPAPCPLLRRSPPRSSSAVRRRMLAR